MCMEGHSKGKADGEKRLDSRSRENGDVERSRGDVHCPGLFPPYRCRKPGTGLKRKG